MQTLAENQDRTIILLVNDYNTEFGIATRKLEAILGRPLSGIVLIDERAKTK
jgi:hypothetical protein